MPAFQGEQEEKQRELAYQLWEKAGRPAGREEEFWRQAEESLANADKRIVPNDDVDRSSDDSFPASDPVNRT